MHKRHKVVVVLALSLSVFAGAATAAWASAVPSESLRCPNTWCHVGGEDCPEMTNWRCYMDGGCAGFEKCEV